MKRKLLYVGCLAASPDRDSQWIRAFGEAGLAVHSFSTWERLQLSRSVLGRLQRRLHIGQTVSAMRRALLETVEELKPDWVHFRLPLEFDKATLQAIKARGALVTEYCNDDPCSPNRVKGLWRLYDQTLPLFDAHFVYRARNVGDLEAKGARRVFHTPPCYVPWRHQPPAWQGGERERWRSDAAFVGHWENDNRLGAIDALLEAGFNVTVKGSGWNRPSQGRPAGRLAPVVAAFGEDYNKIYAAAAAGLCFFSKINRDALTERALEIPAIGGLLVCERTEEVMRLFKDGEEAFFFSGNDELVDIVRRVSRDGELRERVAATGRERLLRDGHSVQDRVRQILAFLAE